MSSLLSTSRRSFLGTAAASGLVIVTGPASRLFVSPPLAEADQFEALTGHRFTVLNDDRQESLVLVGVRRHVLHPDDARPAHCRREPFSLLFRAQTDTRLGPTPRRLNHPILGSLATCLHPVGPEGTDYEVHFN